MSTRDSLSQWSVPEVLSHCQHERAVYRQEQVTASPACVELFRRAFASDQEAWAAVHTAFAPLVRAWIGVQQWLEPDDVLQEAFTAFARYAPQHPQLVMSDELGRVLAFLRQCTKTALLMILRKLKSGPAIAGDDVADQVAPSHEIAAVEDRLTLHERIRQLLNTDEERLVFTCRFVYDMKPQAILTTHGDRFADMQQLNTVIQRIVRRLRQDDELKQL
jgi:hypothetical protein